MSDIILNTPQKHTRQLKKAMTFVQPFSHSLISQQYQQHHQLQQEQMNSINKQKRSSSKIISSTPFHSTTNQSQTNESNHVTYFQKREHHNQYQTSSVEQKREKISQNSPFISYLSESKQSQGISTPYQQSQKESNKQIKKNSPIDFSKFVKHDITQANSILNKQKKFINKQNLIEQIASYGLVSKINQVDYKDNLLKGSGVQQFTPTQNRTKLQQQMNILPFSHSEVSNITPNSPNVKQFPVLQLSSKSEQALTPLSKFTPINFSTNFVDKVDNSNKINSAAQMCQKQCFVEIKDKMFQIKRLFQEKVDQELSYSTSPMLSLLIKKGYKPQTLSFYFSKLIENTILFYSYQTNATQTNSNSKKALITRQHSFKLQGDSENEKTNKISNQIYNNATNAQNTYNQNNHTTSNFSFEKETSSSSTTPQSNIFDKTNPKKNYGSPRPSFQIKLNRTNTNESLSHISSLPHIPFAQDQIQFKSSPLINIGKEQFPHYQYRCRKNILYNNNSFLFIIKGNSVDEISQEEEGEDEVKIDSLENIQAPFRKRSETDQSPTLITCGQLNKTFNLFFKIPCSIFDELIQILLQILNKNIKSQVEINYLIKFLNEQKKEYTPQNLIEEFGSVERLLSTIKALFNQLKQEGIFFSYFENQKDFENSDLLEFINSLVSLDKKKLQIYSNMINSKAKVSFVEFYYFKQFIHKSLMEIFDKEERMNLLPPIMQCIEKVRNTFIIQRENHILNDPSLIAKIKKEVQMKMYVNCTPECFEEYISGKIPRTAKIQHSQTPIKRNSQKLINPNSNYQLPQTTNQVYGKKRYLVLNKKDEFENNSFLQYIEGFSTNKMKEKNALTNQKQDQYQNRVILKEHTQVQLQQITSPPRNKLVQTQSQQQFSLNKRQSVISGQYLTPKKLQSNVIQQIKPLENNHLIINKAAKLSYYEDLSCFIINKILVEQDLKELMAGLNTRLMKVDVYIIDFIWRNIEEILHINQVQADIIQDIKVRIFKLKLFLIPNFQSQYESDEFRQVLQNQFAQIIENSFKKQKKKLNYYKFTPIFDYLLYNYLSLNDTFSTQDVTFSLSIADNEELASKLFKYSAKESFLILLPLEIKNLMDFSESFFV